MIPLRRRCDHVVLVFLVSAVKFVSGYGRDLARSRPMEAMMGRTFDGLAAFEAFAARAGRFAAQGEHEEEDETQSEKDNPKHGDDWHVLRRWRENVRSD